MTRRSRITVLSAAGGLVVAGAVCAVAIGGGTGQVLAMVLIGLGLIAAVSLVFLEVGLSEDRERAAERKRVPRRQPGRTPERPRLDRSRGRRRRLR